MDGQFFPSGAQPVQFEGGRPYNRWLRKDFKEIIDGLGLSSGLKLCLDAGDSASLASSATKWNDLSGNGYDFNFGSGAGADAADPTQNGTPNALTSAEYLSVDGGDYLTYDTTNETWMNSLHKDSVAATLLFWVYIASTASFFSLAGTKGSNAGGNIGIDFNVSSGALILRQRNGVTQQQLANSTPVVSAGAWFMVGFSINEAAGASGLIYAVNGSTSVHDATYSSPTASDATYALQIGTGGNAVNRALSGTRFAGALAWDTALSAAQIGNIFTATRGRFGV